VASLLTEIESKDLLQRYGIRVVPTRLAPSQAEAMQLAQEVGFPAVVKIVSPEISHKSDVGGVVVGLKTREEVGTAFEAIMASVRTHQPHATLLGVAVQPMASPGVEVIVGMTRDPQFGPVIMFGLGGVLVELLEDVAFGIAPLSRLDAVEMIHEIKGFPLLSGYRGQPSVDIDCLVDMLMAVARLADARPDIQELDLNPVFAYPDGAVVVDARIVTE
jgi:acetate---CoA ligase (ADP-forming) subunit beta